MSTMPTFENPCGAYSRYEMTKHISLSRLRELAEAEREGQLAVLPHDVGDTVYLVVCNYTEGMCVREYKVSEIKKTKPYIWFICLRDGNEVKIANTAFGVTAFLTKEEAEAALKGAE